MSIIEGKEFPDPNAHAWHDPLIKLYPELQTQLMPFQIEFAPQAGRTVNVAVTLLLLVTLDNTQFPVPEQSPDHPAKMYSELVFTDNVTPE